MRFLREALPAFLLIVFGGLAFYGWTQARELRNDLAGVQIAKEGLEKKLLDQEKQFVAEQTALKGQLDSALAQLERKEPARAVVPAPSAVPRTIYGEGEATQASKQDREQRRGIWRAGQAVSDVEEVISITPEEKKILSERLQSAFKSESDYLMKERRDAIQAQVLSEVLGPQRADETRRLQAEARQREIDEEINKDVIVLSRRLGLAQSQESDVRQALVQAEALVIPQRTVIREKMREAMSMHFEGDAGREKLQSQYDEIKTLRQALKRDKDQAMLDALQGKLSDSQKNELLALQAQSE